MRIRFYWKKDWTLILILFLFFRLLYSLLGVLEASGSNPLPLSVGPVYEAAVLLLKPGTLSHALVNVWFRWDTVWYLKIAAFGYTPQDGTIAYMPFYPWLVRGLSALTGNFLLAALVISNLACLLALLLFYEVTLGETQNKDIALWGTIFLTSYPLSFFLFTAYTDSLFLALVLGSWLFARQRKWLAAGLLASLATLCRLQGALLSIVLLWAYLSNGEFEHLSNKHFEVGDPNRATPGGTKRKALISSRVTIYLSKLKKPEWLAVTLPVLTFAAYTFWLRLAGMGSIPSTLKTHWGILTVMPWTGFGLFMQRLIVGQRVFIDYVDLSLLVVMLVLMIIGLFHLDPALSVYNFLTLSMFFMRGTPPHLLDSFSRYFITLFPAFIMLALIGAKYIKSVRSRILRMVLLSISIGLQAFLLLGFLDWRWIA